MKRNNLMERRWDLQKRKFYKEHGNTKIKNKYYNHSIWEEINCECGEKITSKITPEGHHISLPIQIHKCGLKPYNKRKRN